MLKKRSLLILAAAIALGACSTTKQTRYVHRNADLGAISRVAVLPFDTLAGDRTSADKVQKIFYIELQALDVFEVADPGDVAKLARSTGTIDSMAPADFQRIGKELGVDAVFVGSVIDFAEGRSGTSPAPEITIHTRLVETQTGSTIWSNSLTRSGASMATRLFGFGGESLTSAARGVVRAELATLLK